MGIFSFVKPGKKVFEIVKPKIAKRLTERRKDTDEIFGIRKKSGLPPSRDAAKTVKKVSSINDNIDAINKRRKGKMGGGMMDEKTRKEIQKQKVKLGLGVFDEKGNFQAKKRKKMMGGGFMGKRMGYKKGSKFPDLTGDGKVTFADILKGRGVINGKKKKK